MKIAYLHKSTIYTPKIPHVWKKLSLKSDRPLNTVITF